MKKKKNKASLKLDETKSQDTKFVNVAICTPSIGMMRTRHCSSLMRMLVHYMHTPILGMEDYGRYLSYHVIEGSMVGQARETFVDDILTLPDTTHLLFIDEDMGFREDTLNIMLARQMPFVACNYRMKVPPCPFTARNKDDTGRVETGHESTGLDEVTYTGMGFTLIERRVLVSVQKPRFSNEWSDHYQAYSTEDRSFCIKARDAGYPVMVDHKASKRVYHVGTYNYSWDDSFDAIKALPIAERYRSK